MSGTVSSAVWQFGPGTLRRRSTLAAIAEAADDHGFAVQSVETIAAKTVCDEKTVRRTVAWLEANGWLKVYRRANGDGKSSVYFIDIERLGVVLNTRSRKSDWHIAYERRMRQASPDNMPGDSAAAKSPDISGESAPQVADSDAPENASPGILSADFENDASGKVTGHFEGVHRTFRAESPDISALPIRKNRRTFEPSSTPPLPPASGGHFGTSSGARPLRGESPRDRSNGNGERQKLSSEGKARQPCGDCDPDDGRCTMNCGPCVPATEEDRAELAEVNAMRARAKPVALPPLTWGEYAPNRNRVASGATRPGGRRPRPMRQSALQAGKRAK